MNLMNNSRYSCTLAIYNEMKLENFDLICLRFELFCFFSGKCMHAHAKAKRGVPLNAGVGVLPRRFL